MLDPQHIELTRRILVGLGGMFFFWMIVVFVSLWLRERR